MRLFILSSLIVLSACGPFGPDYPTPEGAAGAIARASYFGEISEHYDHQIFAAHPEVRRFVRAVSCRGDGDGARCVVTFSSGQSHELSFCRCGGGGAHEWSTSNIGFDDPDIPKIASAPSSESELRRQFREARQAATTRRTDVYTAIKAFYLHLDRRERVLAANELASWIDQDTDRQMREHALRLADESHIVAVLPTVERVIARSSAEELARGYAIVRLVIPITAVRNHLADPSRHSF